MNEQNTEQYRFDPSTGTLYEYCKAQEAYIFAAKANGRSESETIREYEEYDSNDALALALIASIVGWVGIIVATMSIVGFVIHWALSP